MKRYLYILGLLMFSNNINAGQLILGIGLINQELIRDIDTIPATNTLSVKDTGSGLGLYVDYFYKKDYRFNGTLSYIDYDIFNFVSLTGSADYLFPINSNFTLFTGITAGVAKLEFNNANNSDADIGTLYGIQAGAIVFLSDRLMIELGYRIRPANVETTILDSVTNAPISSNTIDELTETYLNLVITF